MQELRINAEEMDVLYTIENEKWETRLSKSDTHITNIQQFGVLTESAAHFVPAEVEEEADLYRLTYTVSNDLHQWDQIEQLKRNDKLRLLLNLFHLKQYLNTRKTFFLHPNNIVFNDSLMPFVIHRGVREIVPPFSMDELRLLKQLQCLAVVLVNDDFTFDELSKGALENATKTAFEREVISCGSLDELEDYLTASYHAEQKETKKNMKLVSRKIFRTYKQLAIAMIVVTILLAAPLAYLLFSKLPYNDKLLAASESHISSDYDETINTLEDLDPEKLPHDTKYILAYAYLKVEPISDEEKEVIMKNIHLKSDKDYLLYWIYNGRGDFEESIDLAKYMDDPQLIMYGLIKKIEKDKNDPDLKGEERDEEISKSEAELDDYREKYDLNPEEEEEVDPEDEEEMEEEAETEDKSEDEEKEDDKGDDEKKDKKKDKKK